MTDKRRPSLAPPDTAILQQNARTAPAFAGKGTILLHLLRWREKQCLADPLWRGEILSSRRVGGAPLL